MMFVTSQLFFIMTLYCVVQGQCDDLTITDNKGQLRNTSTICLKMYPTPECSPFYERFNQSELPSEYPNSTKTVDKPEDMALDGLYSLYENGYTYPGISIIWSNPFSDSGKESVNGYLVVWVDTKKSNDVKCRLFEMQTGINTKLNYKYNVPFVEQNTTFMVRVYSMPPYQPKFKDDDRTFVYKYTTTWFAYEFKKPSSWAPFVMYSTLNNGTVSISFSLPPKEYNMTSFTVMLINEININAAVCKRNVTTESRTETNTQYTLPCTAKQSGFYHITIWVNDEYHMDTNRCLCYSDIVNGSRNCQNLCGGISTQPFYLNITETPVATTTTTETTTQAPVSTSENITRLPVDPITENQDNSDPDSLKYILGAVFALLALFIVLVSIFLCRRKEKVKQLLPFFPFGGNDKKYKLKPALPDKNPPSGPTEVQTSEALLTRKTVYIMSAGDHPAHVELVETFTTFLKVHCCCDVIVPSDSDQRDEGPYAWFLNSIRASDFIIFINSLGAQKLIEAHLNHKTYTNKQSPEDDIFNWGLKHIMVNDDVRDKQIILVSFHGKHCQKYLYCPEIMLPTGLPKLIQKIHRLNSETSKLHSRTLPLNANTIRYLPEWTIMEHSAKNVEAYEKNTPNWLEDSFGDLCTNPSFQTLISIDSGCDSLPYDNIDSVSQQFHSPDSPRPGPLFVGNEVQEAERGFIHKPPCDVTSTSCFTITGTSQQQSDETSLIPPDTVSKIQYESISIAMDQINIVPCYLHSISDTDFGLDNQAMDFKDFQASIIPPDNPQDINVESISSAFAGINDNTHDILMKGLVRQCLQDCDNGYSELEFDSSSI